MGRKRWQREIEVVLLAELPRLWVYGCQDLGQRFHQNVPGSLDIWMSGTGVEPRRSYFSLNVSFSDLRQKSFPTALGITAAHTVFKRKAAECDGNCLPSQPSGCQDKLEVSLSGIGRV